MSEGFKASYTLAMTQTSRHPYGVSAARLAEQVRKETGGRIQIRVRNESILGENEMLDGLRQGTLDIYVGSTGPVGIFCPSMLIVDLPYLFRDNAHVDAVLDGPIGRQLLSDTDQAGFKGLAFWENGWRHLSNHRLAARTPDEAASLKIRTMENKVHLLAFKTAGLVPISLTFSQLYFALKTGLLDGQENPIAVFYGARLFDVQKYLTLTGHVYSPALVLFSRQKWERIPKEDQELIARSAKDIAAFERELNRREEEQKLKEMEAKGLIVVRDPNRAAWKKAMQPAFDEFAKQFGRERIDAILSTR